MSESKSDYYGARSILGSDGKRAIPIRALEGGSLCISEYGKLEAVVKVDLQAAHENELIYEGHYDELTFAVVPGQIRVNLVSENDSSKDMTIEGKTTLTVSGEGIWLSTEAITGQLEIWIWRG